jgi:hypothetical protein
VPFHRALLLVRKTPCTVSVLSFATS